MISWLRNFARGFKEGLLVSAGIYSEQDQETPAYRLSYPDLDAGEEYAGVIEISEDDDSPDVDPRG